MENYIKTILESSAWYEGRKIDISYMLEDCESEGKPIKGEKIKKFLEEFGNNEIEFKTLQGLLSNVRVNIEAIFDFELNDLFKIDDITQDEVIPVGFIHFESGFLLAGASSRFYMTNHNNLYKIGDNFFDALETIVYEKDIIRLM